MFTQGFCVKFSRIVVGVALSLGMAPTISSAQALESLAIKVLGKGLQNKETHEYLGLACVGTQSNETAEPSCNELQHLYFQSQTVAPIFVGPRYPVSAAIDPSSEELTLALKKISRDYKYYTWNFERGQHRAMSYSVAGTLGFFLGTYYLAIPLGYGVAAGAGIAFAPGVVPVMLGGTALIFASGLVSGALNKPMGSGKATVVEVMKDDQGWNWATRPAQVNQKRFNSYLNWVKNISTVRQPQKSLN